MLRAIDAQLDHIFKENGSFAIIEKTPIKWVIALNEVYILEATVKDRFQITFYTHFARGKFTQEYQNFVEWLRSIKHFCEFFKIPPLRHHTFTPTPK